MLCLHFDQVTILEVNKSGHPVNELSTVPAAATVGDLLEICRLLGDVAPSRVLIHPDPTTATENDVRATEATGKLVELVDGTLVEKPMSWEESILAMKLGTFLNIWLSTNNLGIVSGADGGYKLFPKLIRLPDVAFVSWERIRTKAIDRKAYPELAPDLAVEIVSESNSPGEMLRKVREYFSAGVRAVWIAYPSARTVRVYSDTDNFRDLTINDTLEGGQVLPGFSLAVVDWFRCLDQLPDQ